MFDSKPTDIPDIHVWARSAESPTEFDKYLAHLTPHDTVLDLGCGEGHFLRALKTRGIPAKGVELNASMAGRLKVQGLDVIEADVLVALRNLDEDFSVVSMLDFAEHIPLDTLLAILQEAGKRRGTKLFLQTPNLDSVIGLKFYFHLPSHITPLHPFFLRQLLDQQGFKIIEEWSDYGGLPWTGFRGWITRKILNGLFGPPVAQMFEGGGNISIVAEAK